MTAKTGFPGLPDAGGTPREVAALFNQMLRRQSKWTGFAGGVSNIGNTSGTTGSFNGPLIPAGGNNITLSQSTNSAGATYTISGPNMMAAGISNLGNTAGSSGVQSQQLVLVGTNGVTLSGSTNASGQATVSFSAGGGGGAFSGGVSNLGNTAGSTGVTGTRLVFVGTNNISLSQSTDANGGTISISGAGGGAGAFSGGISNLGNTAGSTGVTGTRLVLVGTNAVSLSQSTDANGGTVSFNVTIPTATNFSAGVSTIGNTSGSTGITGTRLVLAGTNGITLSQSTDANGGTISISGITQSVQTQGIGTGSLWEPVQMKGFGGGTVANQQGNGSIFVFPAEKQGNFIVSRFNHMISMSVSSSSNSSHAGAISLYVGIYTRNASTLSLASSGSGANSWSNTSSNSINSLTGVRGITAAINATVTPGDYWIAVMSRTSTTNANWFTATNIQIAGIMTAFNGYLGQATNNSHQVVIGHGSWSTTSTALPNSIAFSHLTGTGAVPVRVPICNFVNFTA